MAFVDLNSSSSFDTGDTVVAVQGALESKNTFVAGNSTVALRFNREGFLADQTNPVLITLTPPTNAAAQKRCLSVSRVGRLTQLKPASGTC